MKAIVVGLMLALAGASAASADDALLGKLVGAWTGRGTMKLSADAQPERVYCKIVNTLGADGKTLDQKGRCSLTSNSGRIDGSITAEGAGAYRGVLNSLASKGPATLSGHGTATYLDLNATFIDALSGAPTQSITTIEVLPDGYRLSAVRVNPKDGKSYASSAIVFSAK